MRKNHFYIVLATLTAIPLILPLLKPGFLVTDDGGWMIIRFSAFYQELINGQFPVRWLNRLNNGYGYPVATFLYPGFMYLASVFKLIGFGYINSIKIVLIVSVFLSATFSFLWLEQKFSKRSAFIGSLFYIYNPYFVFDIYKRGSVGEISALAVIAFLLYAISQKNWIWISIGYGLLIISHNTLALIFLPVLSIYHLAIVRITNFKVPVTSLILGLCLSAFFWLPALYELRFVQFNQVQISDTSYYLWNKFPLARYIQFPFRLLSLLAPIIAYLSAFIINKKSLALTVIVGIILFLYLNINIISNNKGFNTYPDSYYSTNQATTTVQDEYMPIWVKEKPHSNPDQLAWFRDPNNTIYVKENKLNSINLQITTISESTLQINKIYWPGWVAKIDGNAGKISFSNTGGLMEIKVPSGAHHIELMFRETRFRLVSNTISFVALIISLKLLLWKKN